MATFGRRFGQALKMIALPPFLVGAALQPVIAPAAHASAVEKIYANPLLGQTQIEIERRALNIRVRPEVVSARNRALGLVKSHALAGSAENAALAARDLDKWVTQLIVQELLPLYPGSIFYAVETTGHSWHGVSFPGTALAIDNPDNIYRLAALKGSTAYTLKGRVTPAKPSLLVFQLSRYPHGIGWAAAASGNDNASYATLTSNGLETAPDGSFQITIDRSTAPGNHMQFPDDGDFMFTIRDSLSNWKQIPAELSMVATPSARVADEPDEKVAARVVDHMPGFVSYILGFVDSYHSHPAENTLGAPYGREGGWGFATASRYRLADDEALLVTITDANANYFGIQTTDAWMVSPPSTEAIISRNKAQSVANADGTRTFIVSPRDPGRANWVGTAGLHEGWIQVRWQGVPPHADSRDLLRGVRLVKLADLDRSVAKDLPRVTAAQRSAELEEHRSQWLLRTAAVRPGDSGKPAW